MLHRTHENSFTGNKEQIPNKSRRILFIKKERFGKMKQNLVFIIIKV